jgi:very-short-patch-repair endonuclease
VRSQRDFSTANARARRLRAAPTPAEQRFWKLLRKLDGFHFRRQAPVGGFVFDFADHGAKLLIELDGGIHALPDVAARDAAKEIWARAQGYRLVRIPNEHVFGTGESAIAAVLSAARSSASGRG